MKTIIGLIALFTVFSFATKENLNQLAFLEGQWKIEGKEDYESWEIVNDKELKGNAYKIRGGKKTTTEFLYLKMLEGKITYTAVVPNQNGGLPVDFMLNEAVKSKWSFENLAHDFPKKIQYTKIDDTTLFIEVRGEGDQGFSYRMKKQ